MGVRFAHCKSSWVYLYAESNQFLSICRVLWFPRRKSWGRGVSFFAMLGGIQKNPALIGGPGFCHFGYFRVGNG